jgi:RNA polymerase sigma-70 factor (ECF subfamily)
MVALGNVMHADANLIQRAQANDRAAFNEIVLRYKSKIYNYIRRMVQSASDAEDLTQETFVRAYLSIHSFQSKASLNTWLFRIATNLCIDFRRKQKSHVSPLSLSTEDEEGECVREIPDMGFDPQRVLLNRELGKRLEEALSSLPDKLRTALLLYDIEGLPYDEIAQIIGIPLGTVKSRIYHARLQMREALAPYLQNTH